MIDFHAHILPGADHGCTSVEETEAQLALLARAGVDTVVATPHFSPRLTTPERFLALRRESLARMADARVPEGMEILPGAEVTLSAGLDTLPGLEELTVSGTDVLLVEMPLAEWDDKLLDTLLALRSRGLRPILAHVDRYPPSDVRALFDYGLRGQLNAEAFRRMTIWKRRRLRAWVDRGFIAAVGSDLHGSSPAAANDLKKMTDLLGAERMRRIEKVETELLRGARAVKF